MARRVLILGAGFAGSYVARELGRRAPELDVTLVDPHNYMLYTPLLPEAASGTVEPRHVVVPVRVMCPKARLMLGRATSLDLAARTATVEPLEGATQTVPYDVLVVALGSITRTVPVPGLVENAVGFKTVTEAIYLRNHVLQQLELASMNEDEAERRRRLTFLFVGGGYAGVEALAELEDLVNDAGRRYPALAGYRRRWILIDAAPKILPELGDELAGYAVRELRGRGIEIRTSTQLQEVRDGVARLSDGEEIATGTLVWTAGVRPNPLLASFGLPLDERGRVRVDSRLRVEGRADVWALGDSAAVPNAATPGRTDPPTCQHALRQARALARNIAAAERGRTLKPYHYRMLGQAATLGNKKGVALALGVHLRGGVGWWFTRTYHLYQLPLLSRKLRVVADWTVGVAFPRDIVEIGTFPRTEPLQAPAREAR